jgi:hypothetical protein
MKLQERTREAIGDGEGVSPRACPEAYLQRTWMLLPQKFAPTEHDCRLYPGAIHPYERLAVSEAAGGTSCRPARFDGDVNALGQM